MAPTWISVVALLSLLDRFQVYAANNRSRALSSLRNSAFQLRSSNTAAVGNGECFEYDTDFPGHDLAVLKNVPTPGVCMTGCNEQRGCSFWSFDSQTSQCYLKCEYSDTCFDYGYDYTGYDVVKLENQFVSTAEECQSSCHANPKCAFFSWKMSTLACYLKTSEAPMGRTRDASLISGPSACRNMPKPPAPPSLPTVGLEDALNPDQLTTPPCSLSSTEYKGDDIEVIQEVHSAPACQALCRSSSECFFWTWDLESETCSLKSESAKDTQFSDKTTLRKASGAKNCIPTKAGCHILGASMIGVFLKSKSLSSYDLCLTECLLEPECLFWAFDFTLEKESCKLYSNKLVYTTSAVPYETVAGPVGCDADGARPILIDSAACGCTERCYEQADYVGHDIDKDTSGKIKSPGDCQALCKKNNKCRFWTYYARQRSCYLKDADALVGKVNDSTTLGRYSGPKECMISSDYILSFTCEVGPGCIELNTLYVGETHSQGFASDYAACSARCSAVKECTKWVYAVESRFCILKTGETRQLKGSRSGLMAGAQHCPRELEAVQDMQQQAECYDYQLKYPTSLSIMNVTALSFPPTSHLLSEFTNSATSAATCQALCKMEPRCKSFVFTEPSLCYLLPEEFVAEDDDVLIDPKSTSGPRECKETGFRTWFDGYLVGHEDPTNANDIADEATFVSTPGSCADRCNSTPACESWTYYITELEINCRLFSDRPERVSQDEAVAAVIPGRSTSVTAKSGYRIISPFIQGGTGFSVAPLRDDINVASYVTCLGLCGSTKGCLYWSTTLMPSVSMRKDISTLYTCRLYDYTARRATMSDPMATSGTVIAPGMYNIGLQVTSDGCDIQTGKALDVEGCSSECDALYSCRAFNFEFNAPENPCQLLTTPLVENASSPIYEYTKVEGVVSGTRVPQPVELVAVDSAFTDGDAFDEKQDVKNARECLELCKTKGCRKWIMANNTCFINATIQSVPDADIMGVMGSVESLLPDYEIHSCDEVSGGQPAENLEACIDTCMESSPELGWSYQGITKCECSQTADLPTKKSLCNILLAGP